MAVLVHGLVPTLQPDSWGAPDHAGHRWLLSACSPAGAALQTENHHDSTCRFIPFSTAKTPRKLWQKHGLVRIIARRLRRCSGFNATENQRGVRAAKPERVT